MGNLGKTWKTISLQHYRSVALVPTQRSYPHPLFITPHIVYPRCIACLPRRLPLCTLLASVPCIGIRKLHSTRKIRKKIRNPKSMLVSIHRILWVVNGFFVRSLQVFLRVSCTIRQAGQGGWRRLGMARYDKPPRVSLVSITPA